MNYKELQNRQKVILRSTKTFRYVLYYATKKETDELYEEMAKYQADKEYQSEEYPILSMVDFFGELNDVNHYHVKDLIPVVQEHRIASENVNGKPTIINETMCYQSGVRHPFNNSILHEDKVSSFRCACQSVKTTSFIVMKEPLTPGLGGETFTLLMKKEYFDEEKNNDTLREIASELNQRKDLPGLAEGDGQLIH